MTESKQTQERVRQGTKVSALRLLKWTAPLPFQGLPPMGKRHLVLPGVIVVFAALMIIDSAGITTFLVVLGVSVLFVIAISAIVSRLL